MSAAPMCWFGCGNRMVAYFPYEKEFGDCWTVVWRCPLCKTTTRF